ncbi:hypothetical protein BGX24_003569 [Mortierella sp. AD032]|nr:hypothetical protein BGX24_003569 [Mortierella sp. AD032]
MMGTFPIPGTNSVSIPSGSALLETPASSSVVTLAADSTAAAAAPTNTTEEELPSSPLGASSISKPPPAGAAADPELIKILKSEGLASEIPTLLPASSGFYKSSATPLTARQPRGSPQKREATIQTASPSAFGRPPQQQGQQGQYQQWQQWGQQGGGGWSPSQGGGGQGQWYPQQGGQQWSGGGQGQQPQWYPPQQGGGQQWAAVGPQVGKPYKPIQKRAITVGTSTPTMGTASAPLPPPLPQSAADPTYPSSSPTFRMLALACNIDTTVRGLLHCSDGQNYYALEQPPNPSNSADPRNRGIFGPNHKPLMKRAVTYTEPQGQGQPQAQGATIPEAWFRRPQPYGSTQQAAASSGAGADATPEAWFRRPQPYSSQPQETQSQAQVSKRAEAVNAWSSGAGAASSAGNQAASSSSAAASNQAAASRIAAGAGAAHQHVGFDVGNLSKWSGGSGGSHDGSTSHYGKGKPGHGSGGSGKKWNKRGDVEELRKWSGGGGGGGNYGGDDWSSHSGKGTPGYGPGGSGKKWSKRDAEELNKWSGGSGSGWTSHSSGGGGGDDSDSPSSGYEKMSNFGWHKRQVGPGASYGGAGGRPGKFVVGANNPVIPVPIDVQLLWDGANVNLVTPSGTTAGTTAGPGVPGDPSGIPSTGGPAIPVPINVDTLVYPDGQMQVFPSGTGGI